MDMPGPRAAHLRPPPTCARCRGRLNRGHKFDHTCDEPRPPRLPPLPTQPPSNWRLQGRGLALHPLESGPQYEPCPHFRGTPDAVVSAARNAMQALAVSPTQYRIAAEVAPKPPAHASGPSIDLSSLERDPPASVPPVTRTPLAPRTQAAPTPNGFATPDHTPDSASPDLSASLQPGPRPSPAPSGQMSPTSTTRTPAGPSRPLPTTPPTPPQLASAMRRSLAETANESRAGPDRNEQFPAPHLARLPHPRDVAPPIEPYQVPFPDDLAASTPGLHAAMNHFGARLIECGATSYAPSGEWFQNQCFYLCLAAATSPALEHIHQQADTPALQDRAVAVFDSRTGTCEIFTPNSPTAPRAPVLAIWFSGAHYRWVRWAPPGPTLPELLTTLLTESPQGHRVPTIVTHTQP